MNCNPLVSIIVNCFNGDKYLEIAISSIFQQSHKNWEIIFWDNQSNDKSYDILRKFNDSRIKYYYAKNKTLLYEARNLALEKAEGEFISFLDVDDWWEPNKLEKQILLFNNPKIGVVYSNFWFYNTIRNKVRVINNNKLPTGNIELKLLQKNFIGLLTIMIKKEALDILNKKFDSRFHIIGDYDLMLRISRNWDFNVCQIPLAYYRWHGENESIKNKYLGIQELETLLFELVNYKIYDSNSLEIKKLTTHIAYIKCIYYKENYNIVKTMNFLMQLPFGINKIKLFIIFLIPNKIFSKFRFK